MLGRFQNVHINQAMLGSESDIDLLPFLLPNQRATLQLAPNTAVQIFRRYEGRGDPNRLLVWKGQTDAQGYVEVMLPPDAPHTYDGLLFRVLWELEYAGQTRRLVVGSTPQADPYSALGLAFNPFRAEGIPPQQMDWEGVQPQHWLERGYSAAPEPGSKMLLQLLGVKGAGKSSHLAHWRGQNAGPAYYYPPSGLGRWKVPPLAPICYWDEACRMPTPLLHWGLARAARAGHTICIGTHRDLSAEAGRYGLAVQTIHLKGISAAEILDWAAKRIATARINGTFEIPPELAEELANECGGSWRDVATRLHIYTAQWAQEIQA